MVTINITKNRWGLAAVAVLALVFMVAAGSTALQANTVHTGIIGYDGHEISLQNQPGARNPTMAELEAFILADDTNTVPYQMPTWVCSNYAQQVHDRAEAQGIRAGLVYITQQEYCSPNIVGHMLNVFETTDGGLVYVDCTERDDLARPVVGELYLLQNMTAPQGWITLDHATVLGIITWW
jgi:hypothetical protein